MWAGPPPILSPPGASQNRLRPFPDGTHKSIERVEPVARDSDGRIRFEKFTCADSDCNEHKVTLHTRDGGTIETTRQILGIVIEVFACPDSMLIQIQPGMRIARITRGYPTALPPNRVRRPYSAIVTQLLSGKPQPNIVVEDLGFRTIDGISARGVRLTHLGAETDGEWSGKPIRITETWASDDLAATILEIRTDPKTHMASVNTLTDIKRAEPDPTPLRNSARLQNKSYRRRNAVSARRRRLCRNQSSKITRPFKNSRSDL